MRKGYKQTEAGVIPKDWETKKLGDVSAIKTGRSYGRTATMLTKIFNPILRAGGR